MGLRGGAASAGAAPRASLPGDFPLAFDWRTGTFQGEQYGLFCYNPTGGEGRLDVDSFSLEKP